MDTSNVAVLSWISLVVGIVLAVSSWVLGLPEAATIAGTTGGVVVAVASVLVLLIFRRGTGEGWVNLVYLNFFAGAVMAVSPMVLHFDDQATATWIFAVLGIVITVVAVMQMWRLAGLPRTIAR